MSANPLRREGGYWKPVLDYEHWEEAPAVQETAPTVTEPAVRHDLCRACGAEFVVDSPFCRMCGHAREGAVLAQEDWKTLHLRRFRDLLGLNWAAAICFFLGVCCVLAAIITGFVYSASTLVDWQAIQIWRAEWLLAGGVAFICGILLNNRRAGQ